ncbi:serine/threonine-protein phosphatase [Collinsella tanakaei]|nr:serine/threonine-protein phosphatase [Collinsella tanakaei]
MARGDEELDRTQKSDARSGRLTRRIIAAFAIFALIAVTLSAIFIHTSVRTTYLDTQANRLAQLADYAGASASQNGYDAGEDYDSWVEMGDIINRETDYEEFIARLDEVLATYNGLFEQYDQMRASQGEEAAAGLYAQASAALDEYNRYLVAQYFYSLQDMLSRMKEAYQLSDFAFIMPNDDGQTVTCVAAGASGDESVEAGDQPFLGDVLERPRDQYPGLWQAFESGKALASLDISPDGSTYYMYVPISSVHAKSWLCVASIPAGDLNEAVMAQMVPTLAITVAVYVVCLAALLVLFRSTLVNPLLGLTRLMTEYALTHDVATATAIRSEAWPRDEVGILADRTAEMIDETEAHVESIAGLERERERVRSELEVASRIQASALPEVVPPFTGGRGFALAASMSPAKEVGGDFFDFFMVDDAHLAVVIADVSDKGVPAALFMMRAKAILKQLLMEGLEPAEAMSRANADLCHDNEQGMFVTVWLCVLDLGTRELAFACGGHNPPAYLAANGGVCWIRDRSGMVLGAFDGLPYRQFSRTMAPGDMLVLYTDGVTEAMDEQGTCFGEERLERLLADCGREQPCELVDEVLAGVHAFAGAAPQADDITVLALRCEAWPAAGQAGPAADPADVVDRGDDH